MRIFILSLLSMCAFLAVAQQVPPPLDFVNSQMSEQLKNQTLALSEPELIKTQARLLRLQYAALIEAGFKADEALQIVIAMASADKH
jgi:hypothetical protein